MILLAVKIAISIVIVGAALVIFAACCIGLKQAVDNHRSKNGER